MFARNNAMAPFDPHKTMQLALEHHQAGRLMEAEAMYCQLLAHQPREAHVLHLLGVLSGQTRRFERAVDLLRQAVAIDASRPHFYFNLGVALADLRRFDEAIEAYRAAIGLDPRHADALRNLGTRLRAKGELSEAIDVYRRALHLNPVPDSYNNLASALSEAGSHGEAIGLFRQSLKMEPTAEIHRNLGLTLWDCGRHDDAIVALRESIALDPGLAEAHLGLGQCLLAKGEFAEGFSECAWRDRVKGVVPPTLDPARLWDGRPLDGKTVLLHNDQGFGDAIQCVRYVPEVIRRGGRVRIDCRKELLALFESIPSVELFPSGQPPPPHDVHASLMMLPGLLGTRAESIPAVAAYLHPPASLVEAWGARLRGKLGGFNVGLCWAGSVGHKKDAWRSMPCAHLAPLGHIPGITFFSLQKRPAGAPVSSLPAVELIDLTDQLADFADTAALMSHLDLIISVDTSALHLAGAIGKPTWGLIAFACDWRWFLDRQDTPWYSTIRLFRQKNIGDWPEVMSRVRDELARLATHRLAPERGRA